MNIGEIIECQFIEQIEPRVFIVSFEGKLLRVQNSTGEKFKVNQTIKLKVVSVSPLSFKLPVAKIV